MAADTVTSTHCTKAAVWECPPGPGDALHAPTYACDRHTAALLAPGTRAHPYAGYERCCFLGTDVRPPPPTIVFTRGTDGRLSADAFPDEIVVAAALLAEAEPRHLRRVGDRLYVSVANGEATYLIGEPDPTTHAYRCARLYGTLR